MNSRGIAIAQTCPLTHLADLRDGRMREAATSSGELVLETARAVWGAA